MRSRQQDQGPMTVTGQVTPFGVLAKCSHSGVTASRTAAGQYVIRVANVLRALLSANATQLAGAGAGASVAASYTPDGVPVYTFITSTNAYSDSDFGFSITGLAR